MKSRPENHCQSVVDNKIHHLIINRSELDDTVVYDCISRQGKHSRKVTDKAASKEFIRLLDEGVGVG
ncbi:unnamed protein product, partial [Rotaria sp. Silwood1]